MKATETWKTFSVFVSSTFKDMHAEREHLNNFVLKEVEEEISKYKIHLNIVDLRWGVNVSETDDEVEKEKLVIKVCLNEIKRCKPFFIGLIGNRYGWRPNEKVITSAIESANEDLTKYKDLNKKSVTALEIEYGVLKDPSQISGSIFCFRKIKNKSEIPEKKLTNYYDSHDINLREEIKKENKKLRKNLKNRILAFLNNNKAEGHQILNYNLEWNSQTDNLDLGIKEWGEKVKEALIKEIGKVIIRENLKEPKDWINQEISLFNAFIERHTRNVSLANDKKNIKLFTGRKKSIKQLNGFISNSISSYKGKIIIGESGLGKSALLAEIFKRYSNKEDENNYVVLGHSANISAESSKVSTMLKIWITKMFSKIKSKSDEDKKVIKEIETNSLSVSIKNEQEYLVNKFIELLITLSGEKKRILLFVDAINYFEDTDCANYFTWLPANLPENLKIICTSVEISRFKYQTYHNSLFEEFKLDYFNEAEAKEMFLKLCKLYHKDIPTETIDLVINREENDRRGISSPLWLNLCVNILLTLDSDDFEKLAEKSDKDKKNKLDIYKYINDMIIKFPVVPDDLFIYLIEKAHKLFSKNLIEGVLNYLATSRYGLREKDLEVLLATNWDNLEFASFRRWFSQFIITSGLDKKWDLSHSLLKNKILQNNSARVNEFHSDIAKYLFKKTPIDDHLFLNETMFHLQKSDKKELAAHFISSFSGEILDKAVNYIYTESVRDDNTLEWVISLLDYNNINEPNIPKDLVDLLNDNYFQLCYKYFNLICRDFLDKGQISKGDKLLNATYAKFEKYTESNQKKFSNSLGEINLLNGYYKYELNDFSEAIDFYLKSLSYFRLDSTRENQLGEIFTLINISDILLLHKLYNDAIVCLNRCEDILNSIPNKTSQIELITAIGQLYERKGNIYLEQEQFEDALKEFQQGLEQLKLCITDEDIKLLPENKSASIRIYVLAMNNVANTYLKLIGKDKIAYSNLIKLAFDYLKDSRLISEKQFRKHPDNLMFKLDIADTLSSLSRAYFLNNEFSESNQSGLKNIEIMEQLNNFNPFNKEFVINLAKAYSNFADHLFLQRDYPQSKNNYQKCVTHTQYCNFRNFPEIQEFNSSSNKMILRINDLI